MPEIVNPQLRVFSNEEVRDIADKLYGAYYAAKNTHLEYFNQGIGGIIDAGGASNIIADGSSTDGRSQITGGDIYLLIGILEGFMAFLEANGRLAKLADIQVNGLR